MIHTQISSKDLIEIMKSYNLGIILKFRPFTTGYVQSNYFLETSKGKYALRVYENRTDNQIRLEMIMLKALEDTQIPYTRIIYTKNKGEYIKWRNKQIIITSFLTGQNKESNKETYVKQLGFYVGKIHNISKDLKPKKYRAKKPYSFKFVKELYNLRLKEFDGKFDQEHLKILDKAMNDIKNLDKTDLPKGMNHGDLLHDDILFQGDNISGILDFDDCFYGSLLCDIGEIVGFWCMERQKIHYDYIKTFLKEYQKNRKVTYVELSYIYDYTILILSIHSLYWTYMEDYKQNKKIEDNP